VHRKEPDWPVLIMVPTTDLITYIVGELRDRGLNDTKTALVKFLYLADVEAARMGMPRVSSLSWVLYRYGPYAFEIDDAIRQIEGREIDELTGISALGRTYKQYRPTGTEPTIHRVPPEDRGILLRVLDRWAGESLNTLLNYVYFETEPMLEAEWKKPLDFSLIQPRQERTSFADYVARRLSSDEMRQVEEIKAKLRRRSADRKQASVEPLPPPRYDEVFQEGIRISEEAG
jgi:hypothetical protein